jgi:hypothetical protein
MSNFTGVDLNALEEYAKSIGGTVGIGKSSDEDQSLYMAEYDAKTKIVGGEMSEGKIHKQIVEINDKNDYITYVVYTMEK